MSIIHEHKNNMFFTLNALREHGGEKIFEAISPRDQLKKEPLKWLLDAMRVTYSDPTIYFRLRRNDDIEVYQAGFHIGTLGVFKPQGDVRDAIQAEVQSDRIKNRKAPANIKRSSTRSKAEKLVELLNYQKLPEYADKIFENCWWSLNDAIKMSVPMEDEMKSMGTLLRKLYHGDDYSFLARLMRSQATVEDQEVVKDYLAAHDLFKDKQFEQMCLKDVFVVLQALPPGGRHTYRMITMAKKATGASMDGKDYDYIIRDFPSVEALPDVVQSKLALMQLGSSDRASMVGFKGTSECGWLTRCGFIGEDLGELLDTGRESKEGGNSLSK